jgi:hypothetical protein
MEQIVIRQRTDEQYHESYWVWPKQKDPKGVAIIPVLVGHLKKLQQGQDCILVGWVWNVDFKNLRIKTIMNDQSMLEATVRVLKQKINNHFRIVFLPEDDSFSRIRVFTLLLVSKISKEKLHDTMNQAWSKYTTVAFQFEKQL